MVTTCGRSLGSILLHTCDLVSLNDGNLINDNIVNGYLAVLREQSTVDNVDIESTFLFSHLRRLTRTQVLPTSPAVLYTSTLLC